MSGLEDLLDHRRPRQTTTAERRKPSGAARPSPGRPDLPQQGTNSCHQIDPRPSRAFPRGWFDWLSFGDDSRPVGLHQPRTATVDSAMDQRASDGGAGHCRRPRRATKDSSPSVGTTVPTSGPWCQQASRRDVGFGNGLACEEQAEAATGDEDMYGNNISPVRAKADSGDANATDNVGARPRRVSRHRLSYDWTRGFHAMRLLGSKHGRNTSERKGGGVVREVEGVTRRLISPAKAVEIYMTNAYPFVPPFLPR
jgi:hypothetical protein